MFPYCYRFVSCWDGLRCRKLRVWKGPWRLYSKIYRGRLKVRLMDRMVRMGIHETWAERCRRFISPLSLLTSVHFIRRLGKTITVQVICFINYTRHYTAVRKRTWSRRNLSQRHPRFIRMCSCSGYISVLITLILEQKFESLEPEDMPIKTQLRLDGSRRRIAEFFANVVLRLILQDLGMLMNKYVKRVNEWIIS
jgi:hypothetical protein